MANQNNVGASFRWNYSENEIIHRVGFNRPYYRMVAETLARYCDPFVPMDTGMLASNYQSFVGMHEGYIRYNQTYAQRVYYGTNLNFSKDKHPLATHHWDRAMMAMKGQQYIAELNRIRGRFAHDS